MPASFDFPTRDTEYWVPLPLAPPQRDGNTRRVAIVPAVARLAPGATREQAEAEANAVIARNQQPAANRPRLPLRLIPLQERLSGPVRPALLVLSGAIALVLLIACANVACLLLSRSATRQRELAVRAAIGAGRGRLVRQLLTEGAVLSLFGGVLGVAFAWWVLAVLVRLAPPNLLAAGRPAIDMVVLAFAAGVSLLTAALFGIAPALEVVSGDFVRSFQETGREASGLRLFGRNRMRSLLTVAQIALALVLLVGAGLLVRSLVELLRQDPGYRSQGVLAAQLSLPRARYPQPQSRIAFYDQLLAGLRQMPVVQTVGLTNSMPMSRAQINIGFDLPGVPDDADGAPRRTGVRLVSPGFVRALGIRLRAGREFGNEDRQTSERVVLVNTAFVDRYLRGLDAVGRQVGIGEPRRIVGVVESIKPQGLDSMPQPEIFVPYTQLDTLLMMDGPAGSMTLVARTDGDPIGLAPAIRSQVARLDPRLPVYDLSTLDQRVSETTAQRRFFATALAIFAGLALVLAGVGLYGVLSSQVAQSIREIGIRMALGAGPAQIRRAVLRNSVALTVLGLGLGLAGAWGLSRFLASLLFAVTPVDPATYLGAAVALAAAGLLGAWAPVRRAVSVDPVVALRSG
jgi:predicted permease